MTKIKKVRWAKNITTIEDNLGKNNENYLEGENNSEEDELLLYIKYQNNITDEENHRRKLGIEGSRIFMRAIN